MNTSCCARGGREAEGEWGGAARGKGGGCRGGVGGLGGGGTFDAESRSLITSKRRSIARGASPGISFEPSIVCVLPEPDWPYL